MNEFAGFPADGLQFLKEIKSNNNRQWFQQRKSIYQGSILAPAQNFVEELGERLRLLSPGLRYDTRTNGAGSIMRIYRDIRFSKDKSPYKSHMGIVFWEGSGKKMENPGFYLHFDSDGGNFYSGFHQFPRPFLAAYRRAVDDKVLARELLSALESIERAGEYEVGGEQYARVPRGYDASHERADFLRYKGLWAKSPTISTKDLTSPGLIDLSFEHCRTMLSLHRWLVEVSGMV
jgi:uncharacterized protein (TIGR02453 family)